jgi:hypothetical protein
VYGCCCKLSLADILCFERLGFACQHRVQFVCCHLHEFMLIRCLFLRVVLL